MKLAELKQLLQTADPTAVLVSPRILARVIQQVHKLPSLLLTVPHQKSYVIDRHVLFHYVEQEELDLEPDRLLPQTVILLARPPLENPALDRDATLLEYWRRLFHANVHVALAKLRTEGKLTDDDIQARVEQIGLSEFREIREVLLQDSYLPPNPDDRAVYVEFAAVYLELRYFWTNLRNLYFPSIRGFERIDQVLAQDVDADALFARTRLGGAPAPVVRTDNSADESNTHYWKLIRRADQAEHVGNSVRAAILRTQAARVAPADLTHSTRAQAQADLQRLVARLQVALKLSGAEAQEWLKDLPALLEKADQGSWAVEARLLYDLQNVCIAHERDIYTLDVMEWALSAGKRPIKRALPSQRQVQITKHLRSVARQLTMARVSDEDRQHFAKLLQAALTQNEERLRERFRPLLANAFEDVGLRPANPPERTAFHKMIEELLDRITDKGFFTLSDLRDTISRNQLKLPDLADPHQFWRGDPLLRLDRRLSTLMDGVYRPGEFYLRWLQRLTSLSFGTDAGRIATSYVAIPFGGAFLLLEGLQLVVSHLTGSAAAHPPSEAALSDADLRPEHGPQVLELPWVLLLGFFLLAVMHVPAVRQACVQFGRMLYLGFRTLAVDLPAWLMSIPLLRRLVKSWPALLFYWYVFKPLVACALIGLWFPGLFTTRSAEAEGLQTFNWLRAGGIFLAVNFALNSRPGLAATDALFTALVQTYFWLRAGLLPGLLHLVINVFKQITDTLEKALFSVDEWLRFKSGDTPLSMATRTVLGLAWFPISYLARFYMIVLIEPGYNPIKAPVSYLAAKLMVPFTAMLWTKFTTIAQPWPLAVELLAYPIAFVTILHLPDVFGFLVWEMKENWSLYRANRPKALRPVAIGRHGETMLQLLRPGFHSGTVPKLFTHLRRAERDACKTGDWRPARVYRHALKEVEKSLKLFVERELVVLLQDSKSWHGSPLHVGRVALATNQIRLELQDQEFGPDSLWLAFKEQGGWLVAHVAEAGWLARLSSERLRTLTAGLAGLYKRAAVQLVQEQVRLALPAAPARYDIETRGLVLWVDHRHGNEVVYDLRDQRPQLKPRSPHHTQPVPPLPPLDAQRLIFARTPINWDDWVAFWEKDQEGNGRATFLHEGMLLLPPPEKPVLAVNHLPPAPEAPPPDRLPQSVSTASGNNHSSAAAPGTSS